MLTWPLKITHRRRRQRHLGLSRRDSRRVPYAICSTSSGSFDAVLTCPALQTWTLAQLAPTRPSGDLMKATAPSRSTMTNGGADRSPRIGGWN
jgi:hypothetical protein